MKIPVQTPLQQLTYNIQRTEARMTQAIATFRNNILTNRDAQSYKTPAKTRDVAIVPYESDAKAVDSDSFAYALNSAITESLDDAEYNKKQSSAQHVKSFLYHPTRVLAGLVIVILLVYIAIVASQAMGRQTTIATPQQTSTTVSN